MFKVYGMSTSGNCHKVRMVLEALKLPYAWNEIDTRSGTTRTPEFLAKNPNGKLPLLEIDSGVYLAESNAIIFYLAEGTPLLPNARLERAQVLQWLFFEQYSHEPYIAVARFLRRFHPDPGSQRALTDSKMDGGYRALAVMEQQLERGPFFVGERYTIADIALYAYTHVADEGGFDLNRFLCVRSWLARVEAQPGHVSMR
ncbi:MAG: glutathione S-transferase family protein [Betaproteobacteria bacterium]|nr:MAG: glutathione S-transferase family protein [Betaproteobacteria bacterium]